jgi:hypothetical protein
MTTLVLVGGNILGSGGVVFNVGSGGTPTACATPVIAPAAEQFSYSQTFTITCSTPSSSIYYTTNGTTPTTSSFAYSGAVTVFATATVQAIATAPGYTTSAVGGPVVYTLASPAATPTFTPAGGPYTTSQTCAISCSTASSTIYYTTNGTTPTQSSPVYSGSFAVTTGITTVQAVAIATGYSLSNVGQVTYTIGQTVSTPAFAPPAGTYASGQSVTISSQSGATIYYTTDGTTPTTGSTRYNNAIQISATTTLKAIAVLSGYLNSAVQTGIYTITVNPGRTPFLSYPNFSSTSGLFLSHFETITGNKLYFPTTQPGHTGGQCWYTAETFTPGPFTTTFQFQFQGVAGTARCASGFVFVCQNVRFSPPAQSGYTYTGFGGDANSCGYGAGSLSYDQYPPHDSMAIKFDVGTLYGNECPPGKINASQTGLYVNQPPTCGPAQSSSSPALQPGNDLFASGIELDSQNITNCTIVYDGSFVTMVLQDTSTNAQARFVWPLNIIQSLNPEQLTVGFSCGTARQGYFYLYNWEFYNGYLTRLASPTFSVASGEITAQNVTIIYPNGSTCYYTINGLAPTSSSTQYTGPIAISSNSFLQAVAIQAGYTDSNIGSALYRVGTANYINYSSGFSSSNNLALCGYAYLSGSAINLTDAAIGQTGSGAAAWFPSQVPITSFTTNFTIDYGSNGEAMCFVIQNMQPAITGLTGVQITGTGGQISFNQPSIPVKTTATTGQYVTITGTNTGSGSISGYSNQGIYSISATNGTSTATLQTAIGWDSSSNPGSQIGPNPITTTAGTPAGLTFSQNASTWSGGPTAIGVGGKGLGYGGLDASNTATSNQGPGLLNSIAIAINQASVNGSDPGNGVGLYQNGLAPYGSQTSTGLNFNAGGTWTVTITYSGTTLKFEMTNGTSTYGPVNLSTNLNIASIVGGTQAYVGFTAGTYDHYALTAINSWTMSSP